MLLSKLEVLKIYDLQKEQCDAFAIAVPILDQLFELPIFQSSHLRFPGKSKPSRQQYPISIAH